MMRGLVLLVVVVGSSGSGIRGSGWFPGVAGPRGRARLGRC